MKFTEALSLMKVGIDIRRRLDVCGMRLRECLEQLFCKHDLECIDEHLIEAGTRKAIYYRCKKCGKHLVHRF